MWSPGCKRGSSAYRRARAPSARRSPASAASNSAAISSTSARDRRGVRATRRPSRPRAAVHRRAGGPTRRSHSSGSSTGRRSRCRCPRRTATGRSCRSGSQSTLAPPSAARPAQARLPSVAVRCGEGGCAPPFARASRCFRGPGLRQTVDLAYCPVRGCSGAQPGGVDVRGVTLRIVESARRWTSLGTSWAEPRRSTLRANADLPWSGRTDGTRRLASSRRVRAGDSTF